MVRILLRVFVFCFGIPSSLQAQDIPLFSQKLTSSLIYNPAVAGISFGSATYTYRKNYANVNGSPVNNLLTFQTPVDNYRFGVGATVYQENVNFLQTTYSSAAFASHVHFNKYAIFSMGVSGEYRTIRINGNSNTFNDDQVLDQIAAGKSNQADFSFGLHYQNRYLRIGVAANRLGTTWINKGSPSLANGYFSGMAQGMIPSRGGEDLFEPYVAFRRFGDNTDTWDVGLYYTVSNKFIFGVASRNKLGGVTGTNTIANMTLGFRPVKQFLIGYSREMILGGVGGFVGSANEITFRYDFNNKTYRQNYRADFLEASTIRRKSLTKGHAGPRTPAQSRKMENKLKSYSPNTRYTTNTRKLSPKKRGFKKVKKFKPPKNSSKIYSKKPKKK